MYANHTQPFADTFIPSVADYPKRNFLIVNPVNISLRGTGTFSRNAWRNSNSIRHKSNEKLFSNNRRKNKKQKFITIYPEAHIWPYYTK